MRPPAVLSSPNSPDPEVDDTLDDLAEMVLNAGGRVVVVPAARMPSTHRGRGYLSVLVGRSSWRCLVPCLVQRRRDCSGCLPKSARMEERGSRMTSDSSRQNHTSMSHTVSSASDADGARHQFVSLSPADQSRSSGPGRPERLTWVRLLPLDDAADLVQAAPPDQREPLLALLDDAAQREVTALMAYAEDVAGGLMDPRFMRLRPELTV